MSLLNLQDRFVDAFLNQVDPASAALIIDRVLMRYQSQERAYHNTKHLVNMCDVLTGFGPPTKHPQLYLAVLYHDAIYDSRAKDNEEASAMLAEQDLSAIGFDASYIDRVKSLIMTTREHVPAPDDEEAAWLVDADLAVLAASPQDYLLYAQAIRAEYAWVPEPDYRKGRAGVLKRFLARSPLFWVPEHRATWEERARQNLARELAELTY